MAAPEPTAPLPFPPDAVEAPSSPGWRLFAQRRGPWALLAVGLIALVTALVLTQSLPRVDRILQDNARAAMDQPPSKDIVVVAIDEKTLAAIGRWPWRRAFHAEVLRRISTQSPRCIGMDLLFSEPDSDHPGDDGVLADAMLDSGCVVLPLALQTRGLQVQQELVPLPSLTAAATAIGHAHLSIDEDGIARSVYLREGFPGRSWPHFAVALMAAGEGKGDALSQPTLAAGRGAQGDAANPWQRTGHELIVFPKGSRQVQTVSYIDVLQGKAPPDIFKDRYVLIGATAIGLGDAYATSAPDAQGLMPGVDIFASVLQGLMTDRRVVVAEPWQDLLFNLGPLIVALLGLLWLRPIWVIALICAMLALRLGIHVMRPVVGVQFAPASGFAGLLLVYPLWSLMRLGAAVRYLRWGTEQLSRDFGGMALPQQPLHVGDFLDRQMAIAAAAGQRMRDVHRFVRDGIDHLPDATMILNSQGGVIIANLAAQQHWQTDAKGLLGQDAHRLLADIKWRTTGAQMMPPGALLGGLDPIMGEGEDAEGRTLLMRCVPFFDAGNQHAGWMAALVDITKMRRAQSQRDEALRFISHDIREPSASILTAIELARKRPDAFSGDSLFERIERHARTGLELADGFVNLARAEAQPFRPEPLDLVDLLQQTIDDAWAQARKRQVRVLLVTGIEEAICIADRSLLTRALTNVLSNALKYSPPGFDLRCSVTDSGTHWRVGVQDHGPGIPLELQSQLFQPFHRLHRKSHPDVHGIGLGLLLVRTAVQRHGGTIEIDSAAEAGCTVTLVLPKPNAAELTALTTDPE